MEGEERGRACIILQEHGRYTIIKLLSIYSMYVCYFDTQSEGCTNPMTSLLQYVCKALYWVPQSR